MGDTAVEKKGRGRPAAKATPDAVASTSKDAKKRKPDEKPVEKVTNGEAPAKRGRGRPPKAGGAAKKKAPVKKSGRGRGRPAGKAAPAKKNEGSGDEDGDEEDEEKSEEEEEDESDE